MGFLKIPKPGLEKDLKPKKPVEFRIARSGGHQMNFSEHVDVIFDDAGIYQKFVIRVQRSMHSEVSLHVFGSSEAGVR
jgi:hypothetical protein